MMGLLDSIEFSRELFVSLGAPGLFLVAILEFFLLPIPPIMVLVPLAAANPAFAFGYALIATAGSVFAGTLGYALGRIGGRPALESRFSDERIERVEGYFERNGLVTIALGAFAPIPEGYELLSIASGVLDVDFRLYVVASVLGRGGKYFLVAAAVLVLGDAVRSMGEVDFYAVTGIVTLAIVAAYLFRRWWWLPRRRRLAE